LFGHEGFDYHAFADAGFGHDGFAQTRPPVLSGADAGNNDPCREGWADSLIHGNLLDHGERARDGVPSLVEYFGSTGKSTLDEVANARRSTPWARVHIALFDNLGAIGIA